MIAAEKVDKQLFIASYEKMLGAWNEVWKWHKMLSYTLNASFEDAVEVKNLHILKKNLYPGRKWSIFIKCLVVVVKSCISKYSLKKLKCLCVFILSPKDLLFNTFHMTTQTYTFAFLCLSYVKCTHTDEH